MLIVDSNFYFDRQHADIVIGDVNQDQNNGCRGILLRFPNPDPQPPMQLKYSRPR